MPAPHHPVVTGWMFFLKYNQLYQCTEECTDDTFKICIDKYILTVW